MKNIETERALSVSLVVDNKDAPPTSTEDSLERALRLYLDKAQEEEQRVMQGEHVRKRVLSELRKLGPLLPVLERVSEVSEQEARRLNIESRSILEGRITSECKIAVLEEKNRLLAEERAELIKKLRTDALTGVASTYAYRADVAEAIEQSIETGQPLWLYAIDVDGLKVINDLNGHEVGNRVLQGLSERLKAAVRRRDAIYRPGGDEFLLLSHPDDEEGARAMAERLLTAVNSCPIVVETEYGNVEIPVSISVGISQFNGNDPMAGKEAMESRADDDLYRAKKIGGKNCAFFNGKVIDKKAPIEVQSARLAMRGKTPSSIPVPGSRKHLAIVGGS